MLGFGTEAYVGLKVSQGGVLVHPVHMFLNSASGSGDKKSVIELTEKLCHEMGHEFHSHHAKRKEDIEALAQKAADLAIKDQGLLIAVGGDGTARGLAQKVLGEKVHFAVVPCGTFNFFARAHHIPEDPFEAVRVALTGKPTPVRLGNINGYVFLINASIGLYAKAIAEREASTSFFGRNRLVVVASTFVSMVKGHNSMNVDMTLGAKQKFRRTPMVFIGNNALQLRELDLDVSKCMASNSLAVVISKTATTWGLFKIALRGVTKNLKDAEGLETFCVDQLLIKTHRSIKRVALDGEQFDINGPFVIRAVPDAITLMRPNGLSKDAT